MIGVDARAQPTAVHPANPAHGRDQDPDRGPLPDPAPDHWNPVEVLPCEITQPVPVPAGVRQLDQAHDLIERRLGDGSGRVVSDRVHGDKIRIARVKSSDMSDTAGDEREDRHDQREGDERGPSNHQSPQVVRVMIRRPAKGEPERLIAQRLPRGLAVLSTGRGQVDHDSHRSAAPLMTTCIVLSTMIMSHVESQAGLSAG